MVNKNLMILGIASIFVLAVIITPQVFAGSDKFGFPSVGNLSDVISQEQSFGPTAIDVNTMVGAREPHVAVNPTNPANVAVASVGNTLALSTDFGATFPTLVPAVMPAGLPGYGFCGDPSLTFDSQGRLFWSYLVCIGDGFGGLLDLSVVVVQMNPTTGATIGTAVDLTPGNNIDDKNWIIADANPASSFTDNLYIVWVDFGLGAAVFSMSVDQGANWTPPQAISQPFEGFTWPPHITVAPNGDVYANYPTNACVGLGASSQINVLRDTNGGAQLAAGAGFQKTTAFGLGGADITCNVQTAPTTITIPGSVSWMQGSQAAYTIADPLVAGKIYVIGNDDPNNDFRSGDQADVVMVTSLDNGMTWGAPVTISTDLTGAFQVMPTGAIDELGNIVVTWYDSRAGNTNTAGNFLLDLYGTFSTDGGATFVPEFIVSDVQFDPDLGASQRFAGPPPTLRIGEYNGIAASNCLAYAVWTGNDVASHEIFYDTFAITGGCEGDIHGFKYHDLDADGAFNNDDVPIEDWEICQFLPGEEPDPADAEDCQDTDPNGEVWFEELEFGDYVACEELPDGWINTSDLCQDVSIDATNQEAIVEFGNLLVITSSKSWTHTDYNWKFCDGFVNPRDHRCYLEPTFDTLISFSTANINNPDHDVLADPLLTDGDGKFLVQGNLHPKNNKFLNTNPGAFYALTTVEVHTDIDGLWVTEAYSDCTVTVDEDHDPILKLLSPPNKLERAIKVAVADSNGDVTELTKFLYAGIGGSITADNTKADVHIEQSIEAESTVYVLAKFQHNLKNEGFPGGTVDVMCHNQEQVEASIVGLDDVIVDVDADLRITNQE